MRSDLYKLWLILSATVVFFASCSRDTAAPESLAATGAFCLSDYQFTVDASLPGDPATRLTAETGGWENGDKIFISVDGSESNIYLLQYDASGQRFDIYNVTGASNAGFRASGSLTGLYCENPSLGMSGGKLQGKTLGDLAYTTEGSYSKNGQDIHLVLPLSHRPFSIVKVEDCGGSCYVENLENPCTQLSSLAGMTWDSNAAAPSYVYHADTDISYSYGLLPQGGRVNLRYTTGDKRLLTRTYAGKSLASGTMATLQGPAGTQADQWAEDFSEYYETGEVITYQKMRTRNPFTIVVLGDGYTAYDLRHGGAFETAARQSMDYLFDIEPYSKMKSLFNIYFIAARSNERGATISESGQTRDSYFGIHWTSSKSYSDMDVKSASSMKAFVRSHCPDIVQGLSDLTHTAILILVNESTYAGLCRSQSDGQAYCMLAAAGGNLAWSNAAGVTPVTRGTYLNLVAHEFGGHAIGRLGDEYYHDGDGTYSVSLFFNPINNEHNWPVPSSRNLTSDSSSYEWSWMAQEGYLHEGLYEGGYASYKTGVWRPEIISCMFDNRPYYNAWSRYLIMERVYSVCAETFNRTVFLNTDSGRSIWSEPETRSSDGMAEGPVQFVPMLPPPVFSD
ncbi:MAG: hypothetical protein IJ654_04335 [Bacteroidales bacterium]|nr:hypothetical protein [Bacteroidales bacterium]